MIFPSHAKASWQVQVSWEPQENAIQPLPFLSSSPPNSLPFGRPTKGLTFTWSQHRQDMSQPKGDGLAQGGKSSLQNVPISPGSSPRLSRCAKSGGCTSVCGTTPAPYLRDPKPLKPAQWHRGPAVPQPLSGTGGAQELRRGRGWREVGSGLTCGRLSHR